MITARNVKKPLSEPLTPTKHKDAPHQDLRAREWDLEASRRGSMTMYPISTRKDITKPMSRFAERDTRGIEFEREFDGNKVRVLMMWAAVVLSSTFLSLEACWVVLRPLRACLQIVVANLRRRRRLRRARRVWQSNEVVEGDIKIEISAIRYPGISINGIPTYLSEVNFFRSNVLGREVEVYRYLSTIFDRQATYPELLPYCLSIHPSIHPISRPGEEKEKQTNLHIFFRYSYIHSL